MNQYICRVCKGNECTVLTSQGPPNCGCLHNSDIGALWEQDSSYQSERDTVLDIGEILESLCKTDLYWYIKGVTEGEDVGKCRGKDCNYCGRYNEKLR